MSYLVIGQNHGSIRRALKLNGFKAFLSAGQEGLEPSTKVLETHVLPLHHCPKADNDGNYTHLKGLCQEREDEIENIFGENSSETELELIGN